MRNTVRQARLINKSLVNSSLKSQQKKFFTQNTQTSNNNNRSTIPTFALVGAGAVLVGTAYKFYNDRSNDNNDKSTVEKRTPVTSSNEIQPTLSTTVVTPISNTAELTTADEKSTNYIVTSVRFDNNTHLGDDSSNNTVVDGVTQDAIDTVAADHARLQEQLQSHERQQAAYQQEIQRLRQQLEEQARRDQENYEVAKRELLNELHNTEAKAADLQNSIQHLQQILQEREEAIARITEESKRREQELITESNEKLANAEKEHENTLATRLEEANQVAEEKRRKAIEEREHELYISFNEDKLARAEQLKELSNKVYGVEYAYQTNIRYLKDSFSLQQVTSGILAMQQILKTNGPFKPEVEVLRRIAKDDALISTVLDSIPQELINNGVPKFDDLADRFKVVKKSAITAAYSPNNTFFGYLYAKVATLFVVEERGLIEGRTVDAALARAEYYLQHHRLPEAVAELETIYSDKREKREQERQFGLNDDQLSDVEFVLRDWVNAAKCRLVADQALEILEAHLLVLNNAINQ